MVLRRQEGLTKTWNRLRNPDEGAQDIAEFRALRMEIDRAVAARYGWHDVDLGRGFQ